MSAVALRRDSAEFGSTAEQSIATGSLVDGLYRIECLIAEGGMGTVYRANVVGTGQVVAIKFLRQDGPRSELARRRFEREARVLSRLDHKNCVGLIDAGTSGGPYVVMEFVEGETLG